jgi:DNA processing protein
MNLLSDFSDDVTCVSLLFIKGIGPKLGGRVLEILSSGNNTITGFADAVSGVLKRGVALSPEAALTALSTAQSEIQKAEARQISAIPIVSVNYPKKLSRISGAPLVLFVLGEAEALDQFRSVAVVGSRKLSSKGDVVCRRITGTLVEGGIRIVSGLALGCDTVAHEACLESGGITVAVMPCGLDTVSPPSNKELAGQIIRSGGCLVSEYPLGTKPNKGNYIQRNRIQSGLSDAVIIVEAGLDSGTMGTAKHCVEQGRSLYSINANILGEEADADGNRKLIEDGANVLENREGVLRLIKNLNNQRPRDLLG